MARAAIAAAQAEGARVTAHCFGEQSVRELVDAGIDGIEHGTGLDDDTIQKMADRQVALVPTLCNLEIFPGIADQAEERFPGYARHLRDMYARRDETFRKAHEAGVPIYAGTDAGGTGRPCLDEGAPADLVVFDDDPRVNLGVARHPALIVLRGRVVGPTSAN